MFEKGKTKLKLVGEDGNAFHILGLARRAMQKAGATKEEQQLYQAEATAGDYDNLLAVTCEWFNVS